MVKTVTNDNGGNNTIPDFHLSVNNGVVVTPVTSGVSTPVAAGNYTVSETGVSGYQATFGGACNVSGEVTLAPGDDKTCTIENNDLPANITLTKIIMNDSGGLIIDPTLFTMRVDGVLVPTGGSHAVTSNASHFITEDSKVGYHLVSITGTGCPASTSTPVVLNEGQAITCTITNSDDGGGL